MNHYFGDFTGLPIPCTLPASMSLCEELHLVGFGCPREDECHFDDDGICLLEQLRGTNHEPIR